MVYQPKRQYQWWDGYRRTVDANIVGGVVEQLEAEHGSVTKEDFLDVSRPEDSPTHSLFEWDDSVAAEAYRLSQSGHIIRSLRITYLNPDNEEVKVPAFINATAEREKTSYTNIQEALADVGDRQNILNRIRGELDAFIARNQHIEELSEILIEAGEKAKKKREKAT